ncbi:MAG: glucosaminidase domain-containing protein [Erysipelotrichales bacterium]|nr:glucosaminidase domain-containing protein [Erysipelotrichales bacterium]
MIFKYRKELIIICTSVFVCILLFACIRFLYFKNVKVDAPFDNVMKYYNEEENVPKYKVATVKKVNTTTTSIITTLSNIEEEETVEEVVDETTKIPYEVAPTFEDDGSIIYDGMTLTELTNKLNRSLNGYLTNTGYFFAKNTKDTGMDPYLSVSIVLLETGCKWTCSSLTTKCNNIGGLKGGSSCNGGSYSKYDTLDEGIAGYLGIIYNNYYLKGMDTAEKMASTYAASPVWASKVNNYINEVKNA